MSNAESNVSSVSRPGAGAATTRAPQSSLAPAAGRAIAPRQICPPGAGLSSTIATRAPHSAARAPPPVPPVRRRPPRRRSYPSVRTSMPGRQGTWQLAHVRPSVDRHAAFEADAHAAERAARLAVTERRNAVTPAIAPPPRPSRPPAPSTGLPLTVICQCASCLRPGQIRLDRDRGRAPHDAVGDQPPVASEVVMPRPRVRSPGTGAGSAVVGPISGSLSGVAARKPVQVRIVVSSRQPRHVLFAAPQHAREHRRFDRRVSLAVLPRRAEQHLPVRRGCALNATESSLMECALFRYPSSTSSCRTKPG